MPATPLVCIVTPSLNQGRFIEAAIRSVLSQDHPRIEYQVLDGGSTDQTLSILRRYDGRIRWRSGPDGGQAAAINRGFAEADSQATLLGWLNADDVYAPGAISSAVAAFEQHPQSALVYGDAEFIDAAGAHIGRCEHVEPFEYDRLLWFSDFIVQPAAFFRRDAFNAVGGLDEALHWAMDYDLWLKLGRRYPAQYIRRVLAGSRWTGENKTAGGEEHRLAEVERVVRAHGGAGLPAFFAIESAALSLGRARHCAAELQLAPAARHAAAALGSALSSRVMRSLLEPATWRIINARMQRRAALRRAAPASAAPPPSIRAPGPAGARP